MRPLKVGDIVIVKDIFEANYIKIGDKRKIIDIDKGSREYFYLTEPFQEEDIERLEFESEWWFPKDYSPYLKKYIGDFELEE